MLVDNQNQFDALFYELKEQNLLAIDLEFIRRRTFFPKPALLQIAYGKDKVAVVDLLTVDISAFRSIWKDKKVSKIIHGAEQDVEILFNVFGVYPESLFDSQIALQFLTFNDSISYQSLINLLFDQHLDKTMQKSNWLARPLDEEAIEYAKNDVLWLYLCFEKLNRGLAMTNRLNWFSQEMQYVLDLWKVRFDTKQYYKSINQYWNMDKDYQKLLKKICLKREALVKEVDLPRTWVCSDALLLRILKFQPKTMNQLQGLIKQDNCHKEFMGLTLDFFAKRRNQINKPMKVKKLHISLREKERVELLRNKITECAEHDQMHQNLVLRVQDLRLAFKGQKDNVYNQTWRKDWLTAKEIKPNLLA